MDIKEKIYFNNLTNYKPGVDKIIPSENLQDIDYFSSKIRNTAKDALSEEIPFNNAKKEITDLFETIELLKKGKIK